MVTEKKYLVLGFGDSLTAGTPGYDPMFGSGDIRSQYGFWLKEQAKTESSSQIIFANRGVPGELARNMPSRLHRELELNEYDTNIILAGSNDLGWGYDVNHIAKSLERLWSIALNKCGTAVACTIPPIGSVYPPIQKKQRRINTIIRDVCEETSGLHLADIFAALSDESGLLQRIYDSGDGLHLSIEGYKKMGVAIWNEAIHPFVQNQKEKEEEPLR